MHDKLFKEKKNIKNHPINDNMKNAKHNKYKIKLSDNNILKRCNACDCILENQEIKENVIEFYGFCFLLNCEFKYCHKHVLCNICIIETNKIQKR